MVCLPHGWTTRLEGRAVALLQFLPANDHPELLTDESECLAVCLWLEGNDRGHLALVPAFTVEFVAPAGS